MTQPNYDLHIFCCTNVREEPSEKKSCGLSQSGELRDYLKSALKEKGIPSFRVNQSGCLGQCAKGPVLVIYPQGIWYAYSSKEDIDQIIDRHIIKNDIVTELLL